jgi:hypothetical protein
VDLVVEDIALAAPATMIAGPAYTVLFRNQGLQACGAFRVGLFAMMDGKLAEDARALVEVPGLAAGGQQVVTLRLPAASMRLVNASTGEASAFNQLLVAVDPDGIVPESNKDNNVATLDRAALEAR